ncbi:MAG: Fe-S oxidoreductase, partial [Bacteroidota bacterium]
MIAQASFLILLAIAGFLAWKRFRFVRRNILIGRDTPITGNAKDRWKTMLLVALGQGKMFSRPLAAVMHLFIYVGFVIINIEVIEILIDGIFGTHRILSFMGGLYDVLIGSFEILALLVIVACVVFLARRNVLHLLRFRQRELEGWPRTDANVILIIEILLM